MVRRLKTDIKNPDGTERFPARRIRAIDIAYTHAEREAYELLQGYTAARRAKARAAAARAGDLVTLILKKRLFSSPAAFALTLESHLASKDRNPSSERSVASPSPAAEDLDWMDDVLAWDSEPSDDDPGSDDERETFGRIATLPGIVEDAMLTNGSVMEAAYRRQLAEWAQRHALPADSKARALIGELSDICRPGGDWDKGERVIVFTEYKATQQWLAGLLTVRGLGGDRLGLLFGGMDENKREHLKAAFQADLDRDPVRILLATDAASEGIDLQRHCHRVIHYDIPFNPNRLEQRIGRVDRHGQTHEVEVSHFVGEAKQIPGTVALSTGSDGALVTANALSCPAAGYCLVGGSYFDKSNLLQGYVAEEVKGAWRKAVPMPGLAKLNTGGGRGHPFGVVRLAGQLRDHRQLHSGQAA